MKKMFFAAWTAVVVAAGCAKSESDVYLVRIAPTISTRVTGMYFDTGDRIGVTITKGSETYAGNVEMTYDGTAFASGLVWYGGMNEKSTLTAYYPYDEKGMPAEFTVAADQTAGTASSDLLVAVKKDATPASAPVGMLFNHLLSQLTIVVANSSDSPVSGVAVGGLVPVAEVDFDVPAASVKAGAAAADVRAFEVTPDAAYRAILVPQQAALTVTVTTADGKSHTKTLSSALLEGGRRYDMSVNVTNIDIEVKLSGEIGDWVDGGSLGDGGSSGGSGTLAYAGATYRTATFGDREWMTQSLRYVPDEALLKNGVWYPCRGNAEAVDTEYVADRGMLYSFKTAIGGAAAGTPVQGICPPGWHIPDITELQQLVASPEYTDAFFTCAGMWNAEDRRYISETKGYLMSCTTSDGGATYSALYFLASGGKPETVPYPAGNGVSLRCVKDL